MNCEEKILGYLAGAWLVITFSLVVLTFVFTLENFDSIVLGIKEAYDEEKEL